MQQRTSHLDDFAAFVGLDWADAKHDVCLQAADTDKPEACVLQHKPEAIEAWVSALRQRFQGQPIAIALELDKGPIVAALQKYDCLVLFPINPLTLARYREAFTTSRAKGRLRKHYRYEDMMTPYDKLKSLPDADQYLKPGIDFQQLDVIANAMSDNDAARHLNQARAELFRSINNAQQPAA